MTNTVHLVLFRLDGRRYALPLGVVERVLPAVEVAPLPQAPPIVLGVLNLHGRMLPVLNVRRRFLMPERAIEPSDWFLVAHTARHSVVLVVDEAEGVVERPQADIAQSARFGAGLELFPGVMAADAGLVLIHDLDRFLSLDEAQAVGQALDETSGT